MNKQSSPNKRPRKELSSPLTNGLTDIESKQRLREEFSSSEPYYHVVLDPLCEDKRMRKICDEVKAFNATFKETDLFKVFQSMDFGNVQPGKDDVAKTMPELLAMRDALYSPDFRNFISEITGCGELIDRVDCAANAYVNGCHLLCHDDVIGNRKVSYIIYLSDPDDPWLLTDGGYLELYPIDERFQTSSFTATTTVSSATNDPPPPSPHPASMLAQQGVPATTPTACIPPKFNTMAIFIVEPGRSYHAVQEVFVQDKPRLSIQGWYHAASPPLGADMASLKQILHKGTDNIPFLPISLPATVSSTEEELHFEALRPWVNPIYLNIKAVTDINEGFCRDSSIVLHDFLIDSIARRVLNALKCVDKSDALGTGQPPASYEVGVRGDWSVAGPTHKRRHLVYKQSDFLDSSIVSNSNDKVRGKNNNDNSNSGGTYNTPDHDKKLSKSSTQSQNKKTSTQKLKLEDQSNTNQKLDSDDSYRLIGTTLNNVQQQLFMSNHFAWFLEKLTTLKSTGVRGDVRRFRPGLDYTIAHYGAMMEIPRLDATLCFVDMAMGDGDEDEDGGGGSGEGEGVWDDGEVGGFECYLAADEEEAEAAEVYRTDTNDEDQLLSVSPAFNALSLVLRNEGVLRFVKYVSARAPSSRWDVSMEYEVEDVGSDSDGEGDEEDEDDSDDGDGDDDGEDDAGEDSPEG